MDNFVFYVCNTATVTGALSCWILSWFLMKRITPLFIFMALLAIGLTGLLMFDLLISMNVVSLYSGDIYKRVFSRFVPSVSADLLLLAMLKKPYVSQVGKGRYKTDKIGK